MDSLLRKEKKTEKIREVLWDPKSALLAK